MISLIFQWDCSIDSFHRNKLFTYYCIFGTKEWFLEECIYDKLRIFYEYIYDKLSKLIKNRGVESLPSNSLFFCTSKVCERSKSIKFYMTVCL